MGPTLSRRPAKTALIAAGLLALLLPASLSACSGPAPASALPLRSEERRVGKECRL